MEQPFDVFEMGNLPLVEERKRLAVFLYRYAYILIGVVEIPDKSPGGFVQLRRRQSRDLADIVFCEAVFIKPDTVRRSAHAGRQ